MIIGITGLISSGKDTIADYLITYHDFKRDSFAGTLKDAVSVVFGWDRELLEGKTKQSRDWREQVDPWWANRLNMPHLTPRWVLQNWGTEVCRGGFHDDIWIASLQNKLRRMTSNVVISDVRFPNEIQAIKEAGGIVIRVKRGPEPDWYNLAVLANQGDYEAQFKLKDYMIHSSETSWVGTEFDHVVTNDGSIGDLYQQIQVIIDQESNRLASMKLLQDVVLFDS